MRIAHVLPEVAATFRHSALVSRLFLLEKHSARHGVYVPRGHRNFARKALSVRRKNDWTLADARFIIIVSA